MSETTDDNLPTDPEQFEQMLEECELMFEDLLVEKSTDELCSG